MSEPNILYVAVKALLVNDAGELLVLKQSDPTITGHNRYHPPGGIVELGEDIRTCLLREIKEETGLTAAVERLFDVGEWHAERDDNIMQFVGIYFVCTLKGGSVTLQSSEVSDLAWINSATLNTVDILEPSKTIMANFLASQTN